MVKLKVYSYTKALGDCVRAARKRKGLTQAELAELIHSDKRTILNIENYRGNPKLDTLYDLVTELEINPNVVANSSYHPHIPPKLSVSDFVGYLKGKSALMIFDKHPEMENNCDRSFWARGYYVSTIGNVDEETVKEYIRRQTEETMNEDKKSYRPL